MIPKPNQTYKSPDEMYSMLCWGAAADPDKIAAVVVFWDKKTTYVFSKEYLSPLVLAVTKGVKLGQEIYPPTKVLWQKHETCDSDYFRDKLGFYPYESQWDRSVRVGQPFNLGWQLVVVYRRRFVPLW